MYDLTADYDDELSQIPCKTHAQPDTQIYKLVWK